MARGETGAVADTPVSEKTTYRALTARLRAFLLIEWAQWEAVRDTDGQGGLSFQKGLLPVLKPQQKRMILFLVLIIPGLLLMMFVFSLYPQNGIPSWIVMAWGLYVLAAIMFMTLFGGRIIKSPIAPATPPNEQKPAPSRFVVRLIAVWSGLFLYGAFKFAKGQIPAERAVPAGVLILAWILAFVWLMCRDIKSRRASNSVPLSDDSSRLLR